MATEKAISAAPAALRKTTPGTNTRTTKKVTPKTSAKFPVSTETTNPQRKLNSSVHKEADRMTPHYVLACGDRYFSLSSPTRLTDSFGEAFMSTDVGTMRLMEREYTKLLHPEILPHPLAVRMVSVSATPTESQLPFEPPALTADTTVQNLSLGRMMSDWKGNRHNSALAEAAEVEERNEETIIGHCYRLETSRMFRTLAAAFEADRADGRDDRGYDLKLLGARLFYAGVIAGRREGGQRGKLGNLLMDMPVEDECPESPVNAAGIGGGL